MSEPSIHTGHRQRMKQRFCAGGLNGFSTHEIMELLLFFGVPQKDTNPLAHRLVDAFGGNLSGVLEASVDDLKKISGISEHTAVLVKLVHEISLAYMAERMAGSKVLTTLDEVGHYLSHKFISVKNERVVLLSMDNMCRVLNCTVVHEGSVNATEVSARMLLAQALRDNATVAVLAHNHPNGLAIPSVEDIRTTEKLVKSFQMAEVQLVDHMIFSGDDYISMWSSSSLRSIFEQVITPYFLDD